MTFARVTSLGLSACLAVACATYDSSLLVDAPADGASGAGGGSSGTGGAAAGSAGKSAGGGGSTMGGAGGSSSGAGGAGAGGAGAAGASGGGAGGASGSGGAGTAGAAGASGAGTAGVGGAGQAGSAGGGAAGTSGAGGAGVGGTAGAAGTGGAAGSAGTGGAGAGGAGAGGAGGAGAGGAGTGGVSGSSGAGTGGSAGKACVGPADCDDANACTTDSCNSTLQCEHVALADDTATPGVTPDPADCKASVCKAGKVALVPAPAESGDDGNLCTTDSCTMAGTPQHTPLTGVIACDAADATKVCVSGVCKANACGDGVLAGAEQCDGSNLNGQTCAGLGYTGGTLSCLPGSCTFATIGCLAAGDLVITEVMYDTLIAVTEPEGEWIEIYNPTAKPVDLRGLTITRGSGSHTITGASAITIQPSSYFVLGASMAGSGGATLGYAYGTGIQLSNTGSNTITLTVGGLTIDSLPYTASSTYSGKSYSLKSGLLTAAANDVGANFCAGKTSYGAGGLGTPGAPNDCP